MMATLRRHHAGGRLHQRIEPRLVVFGAAISKRIDRHIYDARIARGQALVVKAEFAHPARAQIFHHHIGAVREAVDDIAALGTREIQRETELALVPAEKAEAEMTKRIALEAFDFNYLRKPK